MLTGNRSAPFELPYAAYYDKVLAGWYGKSIGGAIGVPYENHKQYSDIPEELLWPKTIGPNDDLDIQIVWLEALQERGLYLNGRDLAEYWQDRCWYNFCEYGFFLHNVQRGIAPPLSGSWNNSFFSESEGCPIRSEIWGFIAPGNPALAAEYARIDGGLDHAGASIDIECFLAGAASFAFISSDIDAVVQAGLSVIDPDCETARAVETVRSICKRYPEPYDAWRIIIRRFGDRDASKGITNHVLFLMALFLGNGDFKRTINICINAGWDADCTAATAGALLGVMHGTADLPQDWVTKLGPTLICGIKVKHQTAPLSEITDITCNIGVEMTVERNKALRLLNAPQIVARTRPVVSASIDIEYPDEPVLWRSKPTLVHLVLHNHTNDALKDELVITGDANLHISFDCRNVEVLPGEVKTVKIIISRINPDLPLADRNLMTAGWCGNSVTFGLGGARQWRLYGPYWDMWNKDKSEVCPYQNDEIVCNPGCVNCWSDFYNQYLRFDHPYVNEELLLRSDIPSELPEDIELGEDLITEDDTGGFHGQACYYLVREFRSTQIKGEVRFFIGRTGPYKLWIDGKLISQSNDVRCWAPHEDEGIVCNLTGEKQRMVIKIMRLTDKMSFSPLFITHVIPGLKEGVSYIVDSIEDIF